MKIRRQCVQKDLVYKGTCKICNKSYIGETKQFFGTRVDQHFKDGSAVCKHIEQEHPDDDPNFEWGILTHTNGHVERKITEAITLKLDNAEINRKAEGNGVVDLYL